MGNAATEFAEVSKFRFGMPVITDDGEEGSLSYVGIEPERRAVSHVGVKLGFGPFGKEYFVPLDQVRHANASEVRLMIPRDEVERQFAAKPTVPTLSRGTQVVATGKRIGHLAQLTIHRETRVLRHLIVDRGLQEVVVSAERVNRIESKQIATNLLPEEARNLVPYVPDEELHDEIHRAIERSSRLRVDMPGVAVRVIDGVVWLQGHVSSELNARQMQDQTVGIRGIGEIHNELVADTHLAAAVSYALAHDPKTRQGYIGVYPTLGKVYLRGRVRTDAMRQDATEVARRVPGVGQVINEITVDPTANVLPVLAGVTNEEDRIPGGD